MLQHECVHVCLVYGQLSVPEVMEKREQRLLQALSSVSKTAESVIPVKPARTPTKHRPARDITSDQHIHVHLPFLLLHVPQSARSCKETHVGDAAAVIGGAGEGMICCRVTKRR